MAGRQPLAIALSVIPSLPRPLLARLVERAIEQLDRGTPIRTLKRMIHQIWMTACRR